MVKGKKGRADRSVEFNQVWMCAHRHHDVELLEPPNCRSGGNDAKMLCA